MAIAMQPMFRRAVECVAKILKGAKATELPIEQATKFALVINAGLHTGR